MILLGVGFCYKRLKMAPSGQSWFVLTEVVATGRLGRWPSPARCWPRTGLAGGFRWLRYGLDARLVGGLPSASWTPSIDPGLGLRRDRSVLSLEVGRLTGLTPDRLVGSYPKLMAYTSETALASHHRMCGLGRARFWRQLGFPNLALARAARARKRLLARAKAFSPYFDRDDIARYR